MNNNCRQGAVQRVAGENWMTGRVGNISAQEAARFLGISLRELRGLRARRAIAFYRIGHRTVTYNPKELEAFLEKCRVAPAGEAIGCRSHSR